MPVEIRLATDYDGPALRKLASDSGLAFEGFSLDWSRVAPYWLVADTEDGIVAALQVLVSFPIGRIDCLLRDATASKAILAKSVARLVRQAENMLRVAGCEVAGSYIATKREDDFLELAEQRGWVPMQEVVQLFRRLV